MKPSDTKSQKYFAVSRAILEIIESHGISALTHSQISRQAKVSRAWIYEYMGKDQKDLIDIAAEIFGNFFANSMTDIEINTSEDLKYFLYNSQNLAFQKIIDDPVIIKIYFRFRGKPTPIGAAIKKYEKHWLDFTSSKMTEVMPFDQQKSLIIARTILTLRLGFYHRVATSQTPTKEISNAKESLECFYNFFINSTID